MGQCTFTKHEGRWRCSCSTGTHPTLCGQHRPNPRDAEIARLKAERDALKVKLNSETWLSDKRAAERDNAERDLARHKRALAAGPAALRGDWVQLGAETAAEVVERAQAEAMKEEP